MNFPLRLSLQIVIGPKHTAILQQRAGFAAEGEAAE